MNPSKPHEIFDSTENLLTVLVGDTTEEVTVQKLVVSGERMDKIRDKQKEQIKQDILWILNEMGESRIDVSLDTLGEVETSLKKEKEAICARSAAVARECQQLKVELAAAEKNFQTLREKRQTLKEAKTVSLPKVLADFNLFSNVTCLRWQFNCEPQEIRGYICNKNDVKTFNLNSQEVSKYYIANYLWDLMEEDW